MMVISALVVAGAAAILRADNTSVPVKVYTFNSGTTARSSEVNRNFDDLFTGLGNIGTANILANGVNSDEIAASAVTEAKLAAAVIAKLLPSGTILDYAGSTAPSGFLLADGKTIGDASSGTGDPVRSSSATQTLYELLWNSMADAQATVSGGRGGSATSDYNAHKTITLPDLRGRTTAALDNLGGTAANRITSGGAGFVGTTLGLAGGSQSVTLTSAQMPVHSHSITDPGHFHTANHSHTVTDPGHVHTYTNRPFSNAASAGGAFDAVSTTTQSANTGSQVTGLTVNTANVNTSSTDTNITATNNAGGTGGTTTGHASVQPTYIVAKIIKLYYPLEVGL